MSCIYTFSSIMLLKANHREKEKLIGERDACLFLNACMLLLFIPSIFTVALLKVVTVVEKYFFDVYVSLFVLFLFYVFMYYIQKLYRG